MTASSISAKTLDERMVSNGFITRKTGFGGVTDMINELRQSGKIVYQLRQKSNDQNVVAEIMGKQDKSEHLSDHLIVDKIYIK